MKRLEETDPLVTALVWEVDRAVKQASRENGHYDTTVRWILNKHLTDDPAALSRQERSEP